MKSMSDPMFETKVTTPLTFFLPEMTELTPYFYLNKLLLQLMCHLSDCSFTLHLPAVTKLIPYFYLKKQPLHIFFYLK